MREPNEFSLALSADPASFETLTPLGVEKIPDSTQVEIANETFASRVSLDQDAPLALHVFRELVDSRWKPGKVSTFVFHENVVVETVRSLVGSEIADLPGALWFAREGCLSYDVVQLGADVRYVAFYADPTSTQAVIFHAMWTVEAQWRRAPTMFPFNAQEALCVRALVHATMSHLPLPSLREQEGMTQLLPCGPYQTFRGPVVVRWNNTCCREVCPFCANEDKPSWGFWAFLYSLGGPVLCLDCWSRGNLIAPNGEGKSVAAEPSHTHQFSPDDAQGLSGNCICGAYWTHTDGWWREDTAGIWRKEEPADTKTGIFCATDRR